MTPRAAFNAFCDQQLWRIRRLLTSLPSRPHSIEPPERVRRSLRGGKPRAVTAIRLRVVGELRAGPVVPRVPMADPGSFPRGVGRLKRAARLAAHRAKRELPLFAALEGQ